MKIRDFLKSIAVSVVSHALWILLTAFWVLFSTNAVNLYHVLLNNHISEMIVLPVITGVGVTGLLLTLFLIWKNRNKYKPVFPPIEYDYVFLDLSVELFFLDRKNMELVSAFRLRALKEVKECMRHYHWSGTSSESPRFMDNPHTHQISDHFIKETGKHYKVVFNTPLYKNDETDFSVRIACRDDDCRMHPHLSFRIIKPTEKLTLRLRMSDDLICGVNRGAYADEDAETPLEKIVPVLEKSEGGLKAYEWVINKPSLLYYYRLDWTFKE
jgi:hypothetical protein